MGPEELGLMVGLTLSSGNVSAVWSGSGIQVTTTCCHLYRWSWFITVWYLLHCAHWNSSETAALINPSCLEMWTSGRTYLGMVDRWEPGLTCLMKLVWWPHEPHVTLQSHMDSPLEIAMLCFNSFGFKPIFMRLQIWWVFFSTWQIAFLVAF